MGVLLCSRRVCFFFALIKPNNCENKESGKIYIVGDYEGKRIETPKCVLEDSKIKKIENGENHIVLLKSGKTKKSSFISI